MKWEEVAACTRDDDTVSHGRGLTSRHVFYRASLDSLPVIKELPS